MKKFSKNFNPYTFFKVLFSSLFLSYLGLYMLMVALSIPLGPIPQAMLNLAIALAMTFYVEDLI